MHAELISYVILVTNQIIFKFIRGWEEAQKTQINVDWKKNTIFFNASGSGRIISTRKANIVSAEVVAEIYLFCCFKHTFE